MNDTAITFQNATFTQGITNTVYYMDDGGLDFNIKLTFNSRGQWVITYSARALDPLTTVTFAQMLQVAAAFASSKA